MIHHWRTKSGRLIPVMEMTDQHLTNTIVWLLAQPFSKETHDALDIMYEESDRRFKYGLVES